MLSFKSRQKQEIFVSRHPGEQEAEPTQAQVSVCEKFQQAAIYGCSVVSNPQLKAEYSAAAKPGQSDYNVAVADFFRAPDIVEVDLSACSGQVGDVIRIKATDDFKAHQINVRIENTDASLIEEGQAVADADGRFWIITQAR